LHCTDGARLAQVMLSQFKTMNVTIRNINSQYDTYRNTVLAVADQLSNAVVTCEIKLL